MESIEFRNVRFAYPSRPDRIVLDGINLEFKQGESHALVGSSGGGKSTIAALASRFWDIGEDYGIPAKGAGDKNKDKDKEGADAPKGPTSSGEILINGKNIKDYSLDSLYDRISFVLQKTGLFPGTLRDNLLIAKEDATEEELLEALKKASSMDILEKLPNGLDTKLGGSVYLSGGEIQRVGIAKAFLKDADVLILDEATSYADPENEYKIQEAIGKLAKGRSVIMIAHRLNTVRNVDCIHVINDGKVAESGSHDELMAKDGGLYKAMYEEFEESVEWTLDNTAKGNGSNGSKVGEEA